MSNSYKNKFVGRNKAIDYDGNEYSKESYSEVLWNIEKSQLINIVRELKNCHDQIKYMDFAAGTGRIISFLEEHVDSAVGIEISPDMIEVAQKKLTRAEMKCVDITTTSSISREKYDLITAFRFFLNAEAKLRSTVIKALASSLKDKSSRLILNNHGNFWSHKLAMWPLHYLKNWRKPELCEGNYLKHCEIVKLIEEAGLVIECIYGCGLMSPKALWGLPFEKVDKIEYELSKFRFISKFGVNQMYVTRLVD